jgi:magnesium transporter
VQARVRTSFAQNFNAPLDKKERFGPIPSWPRLSLVSVQPSLCVGYPTSLTMDPPSLPRIFINGRELVDRESADDIDIYRGDRPSTPTSQSQESGSATSIRSVSVTSSGSSHLSDGRIGAIGTRLERAISRWARRNWADSSSSITSGGSSDSSRSFFRTINKSSRRRRPPSIADVLHREESERAVAARIRAREIGRDVPREFNLYAPPASSQNAGPIEEEQLVVRTLSLDVMLPHLNPLLRNSGKHRRPRHHSRIPRTELDHHHHHHQRHFDPRPAEDESSDTSHTDALCGPSLTVEKGKDKIPSTTPPSDPLQSVPTFRRDLVAGKPRQAWWLDIANPTWGDMKTLGRVNSLRRLLFGQANSRNSCYIFIH